MSQIGIIIWRFQPLHTWHLLLIEKSLKENHKTIIFIGSVNKSDEKNPFSFDLRKECIEWEFGGENIDIFKLPDFPSDEEWIQHVLLPIPKNIKLCNIYCGDKEKDSAIISILKHSNLFPFKIQVTEIPRSIINISATEIRDFLSHNHEWKLKKYLWDFTYSKLKDM